MQFINENDLQQLASKGIGEEQIKQQIASFVKGFRPVELVAAATADHGILQLDETEVDGLVQFFDEHANNFDILKFVPASGAASRMFKQLFEFVQQFDGSPEAISKLENESDFNSVGYLIKNIRKTAFFDDLAKVATDQGFQLEQLLADKNYKKIIELIIFEEGLGYGNLPKAMLKFHPYHDGKNRLAIEEHLVEAAHYCLNEEKIARIHFTISPEHQSNFERVLQEIVPIYEQQFGIKYIIHLSEQKPSTDTIAVDMNNNPFRNEDGTLLFRPGGHGALIENLCDLDEDIIFIKNIDNIVPDGLREETYRYKKAIGGLLIKLQAQTFDFLDILDGGFLEKGELESIREFAEKQLNIHIPDAYDGYSEIEKIDFLYNQLNRPMRICGMVKNEGEPGGGPFWTKDTKGTISLQIVESSQMDLKNPGQAEIMQNATHFNPVDLVCAAWNFQGKKFDLRNYVDPETGFISLKSKDGRDLKALELPGLWNGAMADWITIFVETPIITFNPVKTVNDLLRPQHQLQT